MSVSRSAASVACRVAYAVSLVAVFAAAAAVAAAPPAGDFPAFVPTPGVTPEGVAVAKDGTVYMSVREGDEGVIWSFTPTGQGGPLLAVGTATIGGLAVTADGELLVAMAEGPDRGVFRVDRDGCVERVPGSAAMAFANALAFDARGTLYVTESYSLDADGGFAQGGIWRVPRGGEAEPWIRDPLLTGVGAVLGFPVGANGIACYHGDLYVANTDKGLVVRVPILPDGSPGQPEVWATLEEVEGSPLAGTPFPLMPDGLAMDVHGNVLVTVISRAAVVSVAAADRTQTTVAMLSFDPDAPAPPAPLDTPASLAFGTGKGGRMQLFVTNLGWMADLVPGPPWPGPGLVHVDAGVPGLPLP